MLTKERKNIQTLESARIQSRNNLDKVFARKNIEIKIWKLVYTKVYKLAFLHVLGINMVKIMINTNNINILKE